MKSNPIDIFTKMETAAPPLPQPAAPLARRSADAARLPDAGCHLLSYFPSPNASFVNYAGTLRIDTSGASVVASGDLYQFDFDIDANAFPPPPDPAAGIPIFPIARYRYYLRVAQLLETDDGFSLAFEALRYSAQAVSLLNGSTTRWPLEDTLVARMARAPAPAGYPRPEQYFEGNVNNAVGTTLGRLSMGWVAPQLRKAAIEIDRVPAAAAPLDNGAGVAWRTVYDKLGWDLEVIESDGDVKEPPDGAWNKAEAHAALARRDIGVAGLDTQWRHHILAVRLIDAPNAERGIMYDDVDSVPREGLMVASDWRIPEQPEWGLVQGLRTSETVTYFRTALHELGHAMGLEHNKRGFHLMRGTNEIAADSTEPPFPNNIEWSFSAEDEHRLRHWPDLAVRPGGLSWPSPAPAAALASDSHRLDVTLLLPRVPLGAPVRIDLSLFNTGERPTLAPPSLGLSAGPVRGLVIDAAGTARSFGPLVINEDALAVQTLAPGAHLDGSMTLLAGAEGMLFPSPGAYRVIVRAAWIQQGMPRFCIGEASIEVTPAQDAAHADAARRILATPEGLPVLAFGGDHLTHGIAAIHAALANEVLRPHFAYIEAKRLATRFHTRAPNQAAAAAHIDDATVMSAAERRKALRMIEQAARSAGNAAANRG